MRSIRTKLTLIIIGTSVLAVALVGVSARWITHSQFNTLRLEQTRSAFIEAAVAYYQQNGTWQDVEVSLQSDVNRILGFAGATDRARTDPALEPGPAAPSALGATDQDALRRLPNATGASATSAPPAADATSGTASETAGVAGGAAPDAAVRAGIDRFERRNPFALADAKGVTVIGNHRWRLGEPIPGQILASGTPVLSNGQRIGTVTYDAPPELRSLERSYLQRTGQAIFYAAIAAAALALLIGVLGTSFLTRPVRDLTGAIRKMRGGELEQSVPIRAQDELGELAHAFNDMSAAVARGQRLREQMTADIAHDLRTPLSVLTGYLEGIREGVLDATPATVDTMYQEATQLQRLVEDLRTLSLADAGQLPLERQLVEARDLLTAARQAFAPMAEQAGVRLLMEAEDAPLQVHVDPSRVRQALSNLVYNALQHTPRGGSVRLGGRRDGAEVLLVVADDGAGIPREALDHIFERFYRADASRSEGGGSGLGLPIARSLVEAQGGSIAADSEPGRGTTITVRLPAAEG